MEKPKRPRTTLSPTWLRGSGLGTRVWGSGAAGVQRRGDVGSGGGVRSVREKPGRPGTTFYPRLVRGWEIKV
jgi:hypothetical protein